MPHIWVSHVTRMNESCHTMLQDNCCNHIYEWVMPHVWMSHVTRMNESCHTMLQDNCCNHIYEWVMPHIWVSHVTRMNESCHTMLQDNCCTLQIATGSHRSVWHDSFTCVIWLIHIRDIRASFVTQRLIHMCDTMTHSYVWHKDSFTCVTQWFIHPHQKLLGNGISTP